MGFVEQLLSILTHEHDTYHEHDMAALLELVTNNSAGSAEACRPELNLSKFLDDRINLISNRPECEVWCICMNKYESKSHISDLCQLSRLTFSGDKMKTAPYLFWNFGNKL